jgi:hypothetical protein
LPGCYGTFHATGAEVRIVVVDGSWQPSALILDARRVASPSPVVRLNDREVAADVSREGDKLLIRFKEPPNIRAGYQLLIH